MADTDSRNWGYSTPAIKQFLEATYIPDDPALDDALAQLSKERMPAINIGAMDGAILSLLIAMVGAGKVVELGTLSGYSALWIIKGMDKAGKLYTLEADEHHAEVAKGVFARANVSERVEVLVGDAMKTLPELSKEGDFDVVFLDADKRRYLDYAKWAYDNLRPGGLLIADNAYLFGYLAGEAPNEEHDEEEIESMRAFHRYLADKWTTACLPTPDGMAVALKPLTPLSILL